MKHKGDKNTNYVGQQDSYLQYMNPCSLGIVRFDGRGTVPYIVIRGQIFKYNSESGTLDGADTSTQGLDKVLQNRTIINQPIVGNFDGNAAGREQILFTVSSGDGKAVNIGGYYYKPSDYENNKATGWYQHTGKGNNAMNDANGNTGEGLRSCRWGMNAWGISEIALAAPDIDNDGIIADYTGKEYAFNDPQVLAVMEAPPYFEDIEYNNAGETAISFSKGSGSSTGSSTANRIGTYVSFEQDFSLGGVVDLGGFEFETAFEAEWNNSIEIEQNFAMANSFSTEQAESAVVLICIPVTVYHYNTTSADGSRNVMDITVADAPIYKTIPLSEYNAAAEQRGDPQIGSDIIASTAGQPSTYRSSTTGLKNAVTTSKGTNGGWFATESGESSKSQSVAFDTTKTNTKEFTFNIDAKAGGGMGGFKFGLSGGYSTSSSASSISTEGIERSGTVHNLPTGTEGYSFSWQFVGWETTLTTGGLSYNVPVLSYLVQNVQQPPSKPQNLEAKEVDTDRVTLEWESGFSTAAQYQVYRYMPNNAAGEKYALLGTVSGLEANNGKYTLTDTEVQPSTQYQYVLKSVGTDGRSTDYTDPLAVTTLATGDKPNITKQPVDTSVRPGTDAVFTIFATPTGEAKGVTYRWQSRTNGGRWTDLNQNAPKLTVEKPTQSMSGTEYRCIVSQTNMKTEKSSVVYSDTVELTVGKASSTTELGTSRTGGNATHETTAEGTTKTVTAQYNISSNGTLKTYQKYNNAYTGDNALTDVYGASDSTGSVVRYPVSKTSASSTVTYDWTPSEAGVYSIVAIFGGNSETAASRSGAVTYYAKAADDLYEISVSDCTYGDTISPSLQGVKINDYTSSVDGKSVTYAAYKVGSSDKVADWESGKTLVPGTYRITAAADDKLLASKYITVSKKPITITAPTVQNGSITFDSFVDNDQNTYASLFKTEGMPTDKTAGVYNVSVVYDESIPEFTNKQAEFFSKYTPTLKSSMVLVLADTYTVTYSNGNNGTLKGYQGDYSTSFESGAAIASGSNVIFTATPAENFQVLKWTVKSGDQELSANTDYTLSTDKKTLTVSSLQKNLDVHVEFSNQFYTVSAQSNGGNGTVTATADGILTSGYVLSGTEVTFTAVPTNGYVVKQWTVTRDGTSEIQKNTDGTVFSGKELKLTITANTTVNVTFEATAQYTVHYSAVKQTDTNTPVALNFETTGLTTDGKGEKGSTVTLTAKPSSAMGIAGWQYKTAANGTWINTSVTGLSYTIQNLQSDIWVRALVNDSATPTKVFFGIVNESGKTVEGGTLTAKYTANGAEIHTRDDCTTYSSITFTYEEPTAYEVVRWEVNGKEVTADRNSKIFTYTIDSLTTETTVNVVVRPKPTVAITSPTNGTIDVTYTLNGETVTPEDDKYVYSGTKATVTATTSDNYVATDVKAAWNGGSSTATNSNKTNSKQTLPLTLTVAEIKADTTFSAVFVEKPVVTIEQVENGSVEVKGTVNGTANTTLNTGDHVDFGTDLAIAATPADGYVVGTINGSAVNENKENGAKDKTIEGVGANTTITAAFTAKPKVTITDVEHGTVTVKGTVDGTKKTLTTGNYVDFGTSLTVTLAPDKGYEVGTMDGVSPVYTDGNGTTTDNKSYTISGVDENQTITPVWSEIPTTTVNWSVIDKAPNTDGGTDGTLKATVTRKGMSNYAVPDSTAGTLTVYRDSVVEFTATPDTGYKTGVWQLNGKKQNSQPTLTIDNQITTPQTVQVQFDPLGDKVTYGFKADSADAEAHKAQLKADFTPNGGTATNFASGTTPTTDGSITFTVSDLNDGYKVEGWYVNGNKQSGETGTTFTHEVTYGVGMDVRVKIVRKSYAVNFSATNGTVTAQVNGAPLATGNSVVGDTEVTFTATPQSATGYTFDGWTVNDETSEETDETLTLNITENTTVSAAYTLNTVSYAVNYGVTSENGTLTAKNGTKTFDSGAEQPAGSTIVFTAQPKDGYQVEGWYTAADGTTAITGTTSEQNSYTITNLTDEATVYVAFEPIPTYDITLSTTGLGHVTATVNGTDADIADGKLTVSRHAKVVLTAVPDANQYLTGWTLDGETKGNSSLSLTLDDVTKNHAVAADFKASQLVTLKTICGTNGTLTAQAGYGDTLETVDASSKSGIQVEKGKKVVLRVTPNTDYMVKMWTVNGTVQDNLSNTLTIENLSENTEVEVVFEPLVLHSVPQSGTGYTVSDVKKTPNDYGNDNQIRARGTVTFTVAPVSRQYLTALTVNGTNCLTATSTDGDENKLTVVNNQNGSYTVTVANVTNNITLEATSMQFRTDKQPLTVPEKLKNLYGEDLNKLQTDLRMQVNKVNASVPAANIQYYDIKLQYTEDGGATWHDATTEHFPAGGITVQIPYSDLKSGLDNSYTYTVIHMFTSTMKGHEIGKTESITPTKGANGISFTVDSLSPFAIGWYKASGNSGGGGAGGGGGAVAPTTYDVVIPSALANIVKADKTKAAAGDTVTLTVSGKGTLTVTDANGKSVALTDLSSGKYTFKMPSSKVNVAFAASGETKPCDGGKDCPSAPFKDVDTSKWYHVSIDYVLTHSIMNGVSGASFAPNSNLTRGMLVQILFNLEGKPQGASASFSDVKADAWYAKAVGWAAANKVVTGYTDGTFRPNVAVTREQAAAILYRYAQSKGIDVSVGEDTNILSYADALQASEYAIPALQWAVGAGVLNGKGGNLLAPTGTATRAEIAAIMQRWCEKIVQK